MGSNHRFTGSLSFQTRLPLGAKFCTSCSSFSKLVLCIKSWMATAASSDDIGFSSSGGIMLIACGSSSIAADDWGGPGGGTFPLADVGGGGSPPSLLSGRLPEMLDRCLSTELGQKACIRLRDSLLWLVRISRDLLHTSRGTQFKKTYTSQNVVPRLCAF